MNKNPMACKEFVDSLGAFRDGELTWPDRIRAEEHLNSCGDCSVYLRGYERTIELTKRVAGDSGFSAPFPENLVRRIMAVPRRS